MENPQCPTISVVTPWRTDRKSTRLNSSHRTISYAVFCLKKKNKRDKIAIVTDDMITTARTLPARADAPKAHGPTDVMVFATHAIFSVDSRAPFVLVRLA